MKIISSLLSACIFMCAENAFAYPDVDTFKAFYKKYKVDRESTSMSYDRSEMEGYHVGFIAASRLEGVCYDIPPNADNIKVVGFYLDDKKTENRPLFFEMLNSYKMYQTDCSQTAMIGGEYVGTQKWYAEPFLGYVNKSLEKDALSYSEVANFKGFVWAIVHIDGGRKFCPAKDTTFENVATLMAKAIVKEAYSDPNFKRNASVMSVIMPVLKKNFPCKN